MESIVSLSVRSSVLVSKDGVSQGMLIYSNEISTDQLRYVRRKNIKSQIALIQASAVHVTIEDLTMYKDADLNYIFNSFYRHVLSQGMKSVGLFVEAESFNVFGYHFNYDNKIYLEELGTWFLTKSLYTNE